MDQEKGLRQEFIEVKNGHSNGKSATSRPPLVGSTRLTFFLIFMLGICNFVFQRFNINFGVVCMHRPYDPLEHLDLEKSATLLENSTILDNNVTLVGSLEIGECGDGSARRRKLEAELNRNASIVLSEFDWSKETQGGMLASFYYGLTISQLPGGWFVDRFGAKKAVMLSQLLLSILSLLNPMAARLGPEFMFAARFLQGVANGPAMPAINVLASRWCADMERSFLLGITYAGFGLATMVVYPISAFFCENMGWEWIFYFAGGTGLLWFAAAHFLVFEWPESHPRINKRELQFIQKHRAVKYGGPTRQVVKTPWASMLLSVPVWAMIITNMCLFWGFVTISAYLPTYFTEVMNLNISENGLLSALPFIGMMTLHFFAAGLFDWLRKKRICSLIALRKFFNSLGFFSSGAAIAFLGLLDCNNLLGAVIAFTLSQMFLEFALMGGYLFSIFEIAPKYASSLTALSNTVGLLTGFISPAVVSWLTEDGTRDQWLMVFYMIAGVNALGGLVYLFFGSCELQPWAVGDSGNGVAKVENGVDETGGENRALNGSSKE